MGLDVYLKRGPHDESEDGCEAEGVEIVSTRYPDHLFRIGYWRSSYNEGGINSVLRQYGIPDLYAICKPDEGVDSYVVVPDWPAVIARSVEAVAAFDAGSERLKYRVWREMLFAEDALADASQALDAFLAEMAKDHGAESWSSRRGMFMTQPMRLRGVLPGRAGFLGGPSVWLVAEQDAADVAWYRQALEIVKETAEWVLAQPDPKAFHLHWSS